MPKLKKKKNDEVKEAVAVGEVPTPEEAVVATDTAELKEGEADLNLTADETEALKEQEDAEAANTVHTDKLNRALKVVHDKFNLDGYSVMSFKDQGNKVEVSVANGDFDLTIKIKDCEAEGIY